MEILLVIPVRYGSTRLPGKPLIPIAGVPMLTRVWNVAKSTIAGRIDCSIVVATDDDRILKFATDNGMRAVMTSPECASGSDRAMEAMAVLGANPDVVINLQGDNPTCPPAAIRVLIDEFDRRPQTRVATPGVRLTWDQLDKLRQSKIKSPSSGTFLEMIADPEDENRGEAITFSKREIPYIRNEKDFREKSPLSSPCIRHIGLYGYRTETLRQFKSWPQGKYEQVESLEQMRFIERRVPVRVAVIDPGDRELMHGVDVPDDVEKASEFFRRYGEYL